MIKKLFIVLLFSLLIVSVGCKDKEEFVPGKIQAGHNFYDEDFFSYIKLSTNLSIIDGEIVPKYSITTQMKVNNGTARKIKYYQIDWITSDDTYETYYRNDEDAQNDSRFIGQEFLPFVRISGDSMKTIKGLFQYQRTINATIEEKELAYSEDVFTFSHDDFINSSNSIENVLSFGINYDDSDEENYRFKIFIDFVENTNPSHIDMQSWFEIDNGDVYPLMGLYHYATKSENYLSVSDEKITKEIVIKTLYIKLNYIINNETITAYYKLSI